MHRFGSQIFITGAMALTLGCAAPENTANDSVTDSSQAAATSSRDSTAAPDVMVTFGIDKPAYTAVYLNGAGTRARYGFAVNARFENLGKVPVYIVRCEPTSPKPNYHVTLADPTPGSSSAYAPDRSCESHEEQIEVEPGETRADELFLVGPNAWTSTGEVKGTLVGRMRLLYHVQTCPRSGTCPGPGTIGSNEFTVSLGQLTGR